MESYQYDDGSDDFKVEMSLMGRPEQPKKAPSSYMYRLVAVVGILGVTAVFAYTSNTGSVNMTSEKRIALAKTGRGSIKFTDLAPEEKESLFEEFKAVYSRKYETDEEEKTRFLNFEESLSRAQVRNDVESKKGGSAVHGVTRFSDRSEEEFKKMLGYKRPIGKKTQLSGIPVTIDDYDLTSAPTSVDWSNTLATAVKDQGYCGSCWAFSATSQIESDAIRAGYLTTSDTLSEQQIVSCDTTDYGCDGGWTEYAYSYVYNAGGLYSDSDYAYTSYYDVTGKCLTSSTWSALVTVDSYYALDSEDTMAAHVLTTGPLSVCLDASSWSTYTSGVVSTCGTEVDHCVQATGLNKDEGYWIVRNSWSTEWGINGYIYLEYGSNMCAIANDPTYVSVTSL